MLKHPGIYVDGQWQAPHAARMSTVVNPTTEDPFAEFTVSDDQDVHRAAESAQRALQQPPWSETSLEDRVRIALALAQALREHRDELAELSAQEMGAPINSGRDLMSSPELIESFVQAARRISFEYLRRSEFGDTLIQRRPVGVVAGIIPWNAPLRSAVKKAIPALLAGCTVVLKPAPETPFESFRLAELATAAGTPPGVINVVPGGPATGRLVATHPLTRKIAFTGSTGTGVGIASATSGDLKRLQLELGGKSAAVVLEDADIDRVAAALSYSAFHNTGQACVALTRAIVPAALEGQITEALREAARAEVLGDPLDERTTMGPLVTKKQLARVLGYIESASRDGARCVTGGGRPAALRRGWFFEPTVLAAIANEMTVAREEIFGPVISVIPYRSTEQAIDIANDSPYGLHGAVFTGDPARGLDLARRFDTGSVAINGAKIPITAPFGGVKRSGLGREHGPEGFDHFLEYASIVLAPGQADTLADSIPDG